MSDGIFNFFLNKFYYCIAAFLGVFGTHFSGDGKSGRNGHSQQVHLGKVGTFAAKKISHLGIAFGFTVAECINSFHWLC